MAKPIYLFSGPEFGERNEAVDNVKRAAEKKFGTLDEHHIYLLETPFSQAMSLLQNGTLFSDGVLVICKNVEVLKKKDEIEMIKSWLDSEPAENTILVLTSDEISVDAKLEKLIPPANRKKCWEMFENKRIPWLTSYFGKNGYEIDEDACQLILDMIENNTQALKNECSRLFLCFPQSHRITTDDVESVLTHNREESAFTLFNYLSQSNETPEKRFENGLNILQKIRLSKDGDAISIIAGLTYCFRKLVLWHQINSDGPLDEFTLKTKGFSGSAMQKQYRSAAKVWTIGQTTAILANLSATDMEIRSGGALMEEVLLQKIIYEIVIKKGAQLSVYEAD